MTRYCSTFRAFHLLKMNTWTYCGTLLEEFESRLDLDWVRICRGEGFRTEMLLSLGRCAGGEGGWGPGHLGGIHLGSSFGTSPCGTQGSLGARITWDTNHFGPIQAHFKHLRPGPFGTEWGIWVSHHRGLFWVWHR